MQKKTPLIVCFFSSILLTSCGSETQGVNNLSGSRTITGDTSTNSEDLTPEQAEVLSITNQQRAQNGLAPLASNAQLTQAAQGYAELMGTLNFFSHTSPDGTSAGQRITATGYDWRTWGENIAYGYSTPSAVMNGWMNSSGHRANILSGSFKEIGIGYYVTKSGTAYWVQDFGAQ